MKHGSTYLTRAMKASDPRYRDILLRLGHRAARVAPASVVVADPAPVDDLAVLRAAYAAAVGKKAFHGWDADTLREKIAEAEAEADTDTDDAQADD